jgi:hypothetical protein
MKRENMELLGSLAKQKLKDIKNFESKLDSVKDDAPFFSIYSNLIFVFKAELMIIATVIDKEESE